MDWLVAVLVDGVQVRAGFVQLPYECQIANAARHVYKRLALLWKPAGL